jgi:hypothetical protein
MNAVLVIAPTVAIVVGLLVFGRMQARRAREWGARITQALSEPESLALPQLVTKLGLEDGFISRGKVMAVINPMVARGELRQEEPPGTTMANRLQVLRFRLNRAQPPQG